ncbi:MAG: hypothetical protein M3040_02165 [Bacteroidota bacterium]|nr:hypothetical protein [Bacteroidota bacterium]
MAAKLVLTRKGSLVNRRQRYKVLIDGSEAGQIKNDDTEEFILSPGQHTLQCKINWMSSAVETFDVAEGSNTYRSVTNGMKWIAPVYIMLLIGVFVPFFFIITKAPVPPYVNTLKLLLVLPAIIYVGFYMTFFRKKYLLIGEDKSNPFR